MQIANKLIVANWKSNKSVAEAESWIEIFQHAQKKDSYKYVICPPYTLLNIAAEIVSETVSLGIQDLSPYGAGAYTGEVSAQNLLGIPVSYVILGHSERRKYLGETPQLIAKKVMTALDAGLQPILCLDRDQIHAQAGQLDSNIFNKLILAYEPVHSISTFGGHEDPIDTTLAVIQEIRDRFGKVPVLYGGSVDPTDSFVYLQENAIDGVLVGSASLNAETFVQL